MGLKTSKKEFLLWKKTFCRRVVNTYGTTETASTLCLRSDIHLVDRLPVTKNKNQYQLGPGGTLWIKKWFYAKKKTL